MNRTVYTTELTRAKTYHLYETCSKLPNYYGEIEYFTYDHNWLVRHNFNLKLCKTCHKNFIKENSEKK